MARNVVQFQKGLSEPAFEQLYGTEEQCRAIVIASRWPNGFECPVCGGRQYSVVTTRDLYQCAKCRRQTSPIAGTIFASTHLPLRLWFRAIYHLTQTKQGISSVELGRRLGVTQTTAWKIKHKLKQVMLERDATKRLTGRIEIDDAYLGGERSGGKRGRGAPGKTPFVAAVETTPEGKPVRLKLRRVTSFCQPRFRGLRNAALIRTARWSAMAWRVSARRRGGVRASGHQNRFRPSRGPDAAFKWVNTALGNIKAAIVGTYRAIHRSMCRATSPNSNIASTDGPPCRGSDGESTVRSAYRCPAFVADDMSALVLVGCLWSCGQRACVVHKSTGCSSGGSCGAPSSAAPLRHGVLIVAGQAAWSVEDRQTAVRVELHLDRRLHVVLPMRLRRDLQPAHAPTHAVVAADLPIHLDAQHVGQRRPP